MSDTTEDIMKALFYCGFISCLGICQVGCSGPDSSSFSALIVELREGDYETRIKALSTLKRLGPNADPAIPTLNTMLEDDNPNIRAATAEALGALGTDAKSSVPLLISRLKDDKDGYVRRASADALARIGVRDQEVLSALKKSLCDGDKRVQVEAAVALATLDPDNPDAIPTLTRLIKDEDEVIRALVATCLGGIVTTKVKLAIPALVMSLKDSEVGVRVSAAQSLGLICEESEIAVPALIERVINEEARLARIFAVQALGEYGLEAKAAIPALTRALNDSDEQIRVAAAQSLASIKSSRMKRGRKGLEKEAEQARRIEREIEDKIEKNRWFWER